MRMRLRMRRAAISRGIILPIPRAKYKLLAAYAETLRNVYSRRSI
jgi:hypothetical protein